MHGQKAAKITISLPKDILHYADQLAREWATTRSGVIAQLLDKEERARVDALMEEGYREMAEENLRLAEEVFPLAAETVLRNTRWEDATNG